MELLDTPKPKRGTLAYKFVAFFVNNMNICEGFFYDSNIDKPRNLVYEFLYKYWLFPFKQNECICCNAVRGLIYGLIVGIILGRII